MVATQLQSRFEQSLTKAGLLPYLDRDESQFLDLENSFFAELVVRDSTKLLEFQRIAADGKSGLATPVKIVVRAEWEIERVGDPLPAYSPQTGTPRFAVFYPVFLKSGAGQQQVWVEVTTLASMILKDHGFADEGIKRVVHDFVAEQRQKGGASYWDPINLKQLEINVDTAEYIASRRSSKQ